MKTTVNSSGRKNEAPFVPSEEWIDAFETQMTMPEFVESTKRYARMRSNMVAHSGRKVDDLYAKELVQDALDDTLEGVIAWDPARVTLRKHVLDAIKSRTRHDYIHSEKFRHHSFDPTTTTGTTMTAVESSLAAQRAPSLENAELSAVTARVLDGLRVFAAEDPDVLLLLDAYAQDAIKKVDVMRVTELSSKRYEAARKRMHRMVRRLPPEVKDAAKARA